MRRARRGAHVLQLAVGRSECVACGAAADLVVAAARQSVHVQRLCAPDRGLQRDRGAACEIESMAATSIGISAIISHFHQKGAILQLFVPCFSRQDV